jgi:hypothetical protein
LVSRGGDETFFSWDSVITLALWRLLWQIVNSSSCGGGGGGGERERERERDGHLQKSFINHIHRGDDNAVISNDVRVK